MVKSFLDGRVVVKVGDITQEDTDAIVNAANSALLGGGGVDGAIHDAGGPAILDECRKIRESRFPDGLPTGQAVITTGGMLRSLYVIHTVGPIYGRNQGRDAALLTACYENCLYLAADRKIRSISFPSISTGAFGYPKRDAAAVSSIAIKAFLSQEAVVEEVRLIFYSVPDAENFFEHNRF